MTLRGPELSLRARESASPYLPLLQAITVRWFVYRRRFAVSVMVDEPVELVQRVCAIDIGTAALVACVRVPHETVPGRRTQQVRELATDTRALLTLVDWLRCERVELVAMEATSDYWKPVFYLLEEHGFTCWLLNARRVKNVPGRPKTDKLDAVWLAKVVEAGMCRPSLVHPRSIRRLRDLTRYRRTLVRERTREKQRLEKVLEDAQIKLDSAISDLLGVSGRAMLEALIAGELNPQVLAHLARGRMRAKMARLRDALTSHFEGHHGFICATMLRRIVTLTADIIALDAKVAAHCDDFADTVQRLDQVPGIGTRSAEELIAEVGLDMTVFPTAAHLASWAKFAPIDRQSANKKKGSSTGKGNPWLAATLGEVVVGLARTHTVRPVLVLRGAVVELHTRSTSGRPQAPSAAHRATDTIRGMLRIRFGRGPSISDARPSRAT